MKERRIQSIMVRLIELVVTLGIVLGFFSLFATFLTRLFVPGTSMRQMMERDRGNGEDDRKLPRDAMLDAGGRDGSLGDAFRGTALLSNARNDVKSRRADSLAWGPAMPGMALYNRDAVQTYNQSSAQINFDRKNLLTVESNSLVIIKRVEKDLFRAQKHSAMVVVEGELQGRFSGAGNNPLSLEVATPGATARMKGGGPAGKMTDFKVSSNPDLSSSIVVFKGEAEVMAQGKLVKIPENTGLVVRQGEGLSSPVPLPSPPGRRSPEDGIIVAYRNLPPKVRFAWEAVDAADAYHFQISRDGMFKDVLLDRKSSQTELVHGNLKNGTFYWRVSSIREGCEGRFGEVHRLELVQDLAPPSLEVKFPDGPVQAGTFVLTGTTEPGSSVFIGGRRLDVGANGRFNHEVRIGEGVNLVTVEAVDAAGNVTYRSRYIQGRM